MNSLALCNLSQGRLRTILSVLAVALGVAMIVAADVIANASRSAIQAADERNLGAVISEISNLALTTVGIVILIAAGFLVFNAFAMAVTQRRRQVGALRMAVRRDRVETFLDESRNLFRLTGLIAVLASVLLAQAIGGVVTTPVCQLAAGGGRRSHHVV